MRRVNERDPVEPIHQLEEEAASAAEPPVCPEGHGQAQIERGINGAALALAICSPASNPGQQDRHRVIN